VLVLLGIALLAGVVTAISPCVLPVLPILLAGGATGRKPLRIVAGLVASFTVFTLFATWLLDQAGLPQDTLRNLAIALLLVVAATLIVPGAAAVLERPLAIFSRLRPKNAGGGFFLGATMGLVFVPCAGPVLAAITVAAARNEVGWRTAAIALTYGVGAGIPMLAIAAGGRSVSARLRSSADRLRFTAGALMALVALALVFHVDDGLARYTPGYTSFLQSKVEKSKTAERELAKLRGDKALAVVHKTVSGLPDYGAAPALHAGGAWINSKPLSIDGLRGKVVLIDFWTYSCINCLRTLPHVKAWDARYRKDGLVVIGVHTPEFAFEHVSSNVRAAVERLGIRYPVVQDNRYKTWDAYSNQYWPAEYLIDREGRVRHTHFGEGEYTQTEALIRRLLHARGRATRQLADTTPTTELTPETYLGYQRLDRYVGSPVKPDALASYSYPATLTESSLAYGGRWRITGEEAIAGEHASLRLRFHAKNVYLVLGGHGTARVLVDGHPTKTVRVDADRLYTLRSSAKLTDATMEIRFSPGVRAFAFTFG
jgi:cytochrome c biogenesis protein CcdA/thiol-disulfide isomerase/thioredoxin